MDIRVNEGGVFFIKIVPEKGEAIDLPAERVESFNFEDRSVGVDKLTLQVNNSDLAFFEDPILLPGNKIEFTFGYPSKLSFKRAMKVKVVKGFLRLTVEAYGKESDFHHEKLTKTWKGLSVDEIAAQMAKDMGHTKTSISASNVKRQVVQQSQETYAQFLMRWGARLGCEWFIDVDDTFHFHPRDHQQAPVRTFVWRGAKDRSEIVLTPELEHSVKNKPGSMETVAVDPKKKKVRKHKASKSNVSTSVLGPATLVQEAVPFSSKPLRSLSLQAWHNDQHLKETAEAKYRVTQQSQLKLRLPVVGDPTLTAKRVIRLENFGTLLNGNYYVVRAVHKISGGYYTDLELRRDAIGKPSNRKDTSVGAARENREKTPKVQRPREDFLPKK